MPRTWQVTWSAACQQLANALQLLLAAAYDAADSKPSNIKPSANPFGATTSEATNNTSKPAN
jgi:hypothetical protein